MIYNLIVKGEEVMSKKYDRNIPFYSINDLTKWTWVMWLMGLGSGVAIGAVWL